MLQVEGRNLELYLFDTEWRFMFELWIDELDWTDVGNHYIWGYVKIQADLDTLIPIACMVNPTFW